ncbi:similar to Saccharomyces cerevisiae YGR273C Putative protein of unknown function [Maudiozyma barnettii]|uniref:Uncharacterized protein n=1 Tax=Maudiozyma barnettii TaxID=61262 RepID=A0A8H2VI95_9SACH|nr:hypothetical protein [Kazachstania barnettii]CAB4256144.1 similar to Saccharomyces cerevisiae YGR273C Putative protein of unknown function [Kazachstania barnettii]CAD1784752.1 similar to Saccharomyces cerevisiae YGR273C Putative protein of unknown function [Kazachstania barnettii]
MVHFRRKSNHSGSMDSPDQDKGHRPQKSVGSGDMKLSKEEAARFKVRTASVNDPILEAVQEAQPFEQAADTFKTNMNRRSYFDAEDGSKVQATDVFGNVIEVPDISNPTRSRDERPLDTIRGFEYAITGDPQLAQQIETPYLGFNVRQDFPLGNPYDNYLEANGGVGPSQGTQSQGVYQTPLSTDGDEKKKKKRNWFGRKKKS